MGRTAIRSTLGLSNHKRVTTEETLFSLTYRIETIIPIDVFKATLHTKGVEWDKNVAQLRLVQDHSKERRRQAMIQITTYQQQIKASHHKKVKPQEFQIGDLVLKHVIWSTKERDVEKLGANLEGPYIMVTKRGKGSYNLTTQDRKVFGKLESFHLKWYYM